MATTLQPVPVSISGLNQGLEALPQKTVFPAPGAIWRRGDFLAKVTTGSIVNPNPNGSIVNFVPTSLPILSTTTAATNPQQTLYAFYTLIGSGSIESQPSAQFVLNVPAGKEATVEVPADGNYPAAAADFALYVGQLPNGEWQQVASTALGSAATVPAYPLTNNTGANRAATNASGSILGYAVNNSDVTFANLPGTGLQAGSSYRAIFGQDQSGPIGIGFEQYQGYFIDLSNVSFVISLVQPYYGSVLQSTAGLLYNTTYQCFQADTSQSNKLLTITGKFGQPNANPSFDPVGGPGDINALVIARFNSGLLVQ